MVAVVGAWNLRSLEPMMADMVARLAQTSRDAYWDLSGVTRLDHAGAMMLWRVWGYQRATKLTLRPEHEIIFTHLNLVSAAPVEAPPADRLAFVVAIGAQVLLGKVGRERLVAALAQLKSAGARVLAMVPSREAVIVRMGWTFRRKQFDSCAFVAAALKALPH